MEKQILIRITTDDTGKYCHRTCRYFRIDERIIGKTSGYCAVFGLLAPTDQKANFPGAWYRCNKCKKAAVKDESDNG